MVRHSRRGWSVSLGSCIVMFLIANKFFKCDNESGLLEKEEYEFDDLGLIDGRPVNISYPRDRVVFLLRPTRVVKEIRNPQSYSCKNTTKFSEKNHLVVFVKSAAQYRDRRDAVRNTWASVTHLQNLVLYVVFVVGMSEPTTMEMIREENKAKGDILQFIGVDDYRHIALKVLAGMQWASENLPVHFMYATADDDFEVDLSRIAKHFQEHIDRAKRKSPNSSYQIYTHIPMLCVFVYRHNEIPIRDKNSRYGKYYLDPSEFPMTFFPPFCSGGWYLMPVERVKKLYEVTRKYKALPMDDVWLTGILRLKIHPTDIEPFTTAKRGPVHHLWGDFGENKDIPNMLIKSWQPMWQKVKKRKHCVRRLLSYS